MKHRGNSLAARGRQPASWLWIDAALVILLLLAAPTNAANDPTPSSTDPHSGESTADDQGDAEQAKKEHSGEDREEHGKGGHSSRFSDEEIPLQLEGFPQRPKPLLELGEPFLGTGTLKPGFRLPTGAVWQPSLLAFGTFRSAIQTFEPDLQGVEGRVTEWANRLDLFFNLQLSGSERLVVGLRALDEDGRFTSYFFEHPDANLDGEFESELNAEISSLYFEGDIGEIFPNLDREDFGALDVGFSIGRQPISFQEGLLIADTIDGIGFTRNTLLPANTSNFRATFFYGWDNLHRGSVAGGNVEDKDAQLFALFTSTDTARSTFDVDLAYVRSDSLAGDLAVAGISAVQRFGKTSSSFRLLSSFAIDEETPFSGNGTLLMSELSWTPAYTSDLFYINNFVAFDRFSSAARGPAAGGPLGRVGINFAAVGLGSYGAPLSNLAQDVVGGAIGYQKFLGHSRRQLVVEVAARLGLEDAVEDSYGLTARYQAAFGRRVLVVTDAFISQRQRAGGDQTPFGGRLELVVKF